MEALDELDRVCGVKLSDEVLAMETVSPEANSKASKLLGGVLLVANDKSDEGDDWFKEIIMEHRVMFQRALAKGYQTLINEDKA